MKKVLAIDMGFANLAYCMVGSNARRAPLAWHCERIWDGQGKPTGDNLFWAIHNWVYAHRDLLIEADAIVLERQMQARFKCMNTVVRTLYPFKTELVSPLTIQRLFKLPKGRDAKKRDAVKQCAKLFDTPIPEIGFKKDDMADAALMALWWLNKEKH